MEIDRKLGLLACALACGACGGATKTPAPAPDLTASATLSTGGGTVTNAAGAKVTLPFGALDAPTEISVTTTDLPAPAGVAALSPVYAFGPAGALFARPVRVTLPLPPGVSAASIYWSRPGGSAFDSIGGTVDLAARTITAEVGHFSQAVLGPATATRAVTGTAVVTWISSTSRSSEPRALTGAPEALVSDGAGGLVAIPGAIGTGPAAGTFTFPGVPPGDYILRFGSTYLVTSSSAPDLGLAAGGKPPAQRTVASAGTGLDLSVTGLAPWQDADQLEFFSTQVDDWDFVSERWASPPLAASDTAALLKLDVPSLNGNLQAPWLIESSKGDEAFLAQLTTRVSPGGATYQAMSRLARLPAFDLAAGQVTPVSVALADVSLGRSISLDVRGKSWASALALDGNPGALATCQLVPRPVRCSSFVGVLGQAGTAEDGFYTGNADLLLYSDPDVVAGTDVLTGPMDHGSPASLPGNWGEIATVRWQFPVTLRLPGTTAGSRSLGDSLEWTTAPAILGAGPVVPPLTAPRGITVAGQPLFAGGSGIGLTPTFAWSAPRTGDPTLYCVGVFELTVSPTNTTATSRAATICTPHLGVTLPPGILGAGKTYAFQVSAVAGTTPASALRLADSPLRAGLDLATAGVASGIFTP